MNHLILIIFFFIIPLASQAKNCLAPQSGLQKEISFEIVDTGDYTFKGTPDLSGQDMHTDSGLCIHLRINWKDITNTLSQLNDLSQILIFGGTFEEVDELLKFLNKQNFQFPTTIHIVNPDNYELKKFEKNKNHFKNWQILSPKLKTIKFYQIEAEYIDRFIPENTICLAMGFGVFGATNPVDDENLSRTLTSTHKIIQYNGILFHSGLNQRIQERKFLFQTPIIRNGWKLEKELTIKEEIYPPEDIQSFIFSHPDLFFPPGYSKTWITNHSIDALLKWMPPNLDVINVMRSYKTSA